MGRAQALIVAVAAAFLGAVMLVFFSGETTPDIPRPAPMFRLPTLDGTELDLAQAGQVVLVNFWATWCPPCLEETPSLNALHQRLEARGFAVYGVTVDTERAAVDRFVSQYRVKFPILLDPTSSTAHRYGTFKFPESFLVDRDGQIVRKYVGAIDWTSAEVLAEITSYL